MCLSLLCDCAGFSLTDLWKELVPSVPMRLNLVVVVVVVVVIVVVVVVLYTEGGLLSLLWCYIVSLIPSVSESHRTDSFKTSRILF